MVPISDYNPARRPAFMTWALIAVCIVAYLWERSLGAQMNVALKVLGFVPANYFAALHAGHIAASSVWTILTSIFLHAGLLHLAGNLLYLWIFGNNVEDALGHPRFLLRSGHLAFPRQAKRPVGWLISRWHGSCFSSIVQTGLHTLWVMPERLGLAGSHETSK